MDWNNLTETGQLGQLDATSEHQAVLLYKHSTRCGISSAAMGRIERKWTDGDHARLKPYYVDVLRHRDVSDAISERYGVEHASPQVLIIRNGKCVLALSHTDISYDDLMAVT